MKSLIRPLLIAASLFVTGTCADLSAQNRAPSPERFFDYLDRNKDGKLDPDELRRMPGSFRTAFEQSRIRLDRDVSREVFMREIPKAFEQMQRDRESSSNNRGRDDRSRSDDRRRTDDRGRNSNRANSSSRDSSIYTPRPQVPITVSLPRRFEDDDLDGDGQISYHEWRQTRPNERAHFKVYDRNGDGFLTPRELLNPPTTAELLAATAGASEEDADSAGSTTTTARSTRGSTNTRTPTSTRNGPPMTRGPGGGRFTGAGGGGPPTREARGSRRGGGGNNFRRDDGPRTGGDRSREQRSSSATNTTTSNTAAAPVQVAGNTASPAAANTNEDATTRTARLFFSQMDVDKNKQITPDEWERSRRLKPKFEDAGIDLSVSMNEQQFIEAYRKAHAE
jgi:Ca2+-binding EF-hand superfamily protein